MRSLRRDGVGILQTRCEYIHVRSTASSLKPTVRPGTHACADVETRLHWHGWYHKKSWASSRRSATPAERIP